MAPAGRRQRWEDLNRDLLIFIFAKLGVEDLIAGVPLACTTWRDAARDPRCWERPDFQRWPAIASRLQCRREPSLDLHALLNFFAARADQAVQSIWFPDFADATDLSFVAERCPVLRYFSLPNDDIIIEKFCEAVGKLELLEGIAVNEGVICKEVLHHIKRSCLHLSELEVFAGCMDVNMATIICEALPHLRKLKLKGDCLSQKVILLFLNKLKDLEYLDISGYNTAGITGAVLEEASRLKEFCWCSEFAEGLFDYCSDGNDDISFTNPSKCMLDGQVMESVASQS